VYKDFPRTRLGVIAATNKSLVLDDWVTLAVTNHEALAQVLVRMDSGASLRLPIVRVVKQCFFFCGVTCRLVLFQ
jgi:hypothetical protein